MIKKMSEFRKLLEKITIERNILCDKNKELSYHNLLLIKHEKDIEEITVKRDLTKNIIEKLEESVKNINNNINELKHKVDTYIENR